MGDASRACVAPGGFAKWTPVYGDRPVSEAGQLICPTTKAGTAGAKRLTRAAMTDAAFIHGVRG